MLRLFTVALLSSHSKAKPIAAPDPSWRFVPSLFPPFYSLPRGLRCANRAVGDRCRRLETHTSVPAAAGRSVHVHREQGTHSIAARTASSCAGRDRRSAAKCGVGLVGFKPFDD